MQYAGRIDFQKFPVRFLLLMDSSKTNEAASQFAAHQPLIQLEEKIDMMIDPTFLIHCLEKLKIRKIEVFYFEFFEWK